MAITIRMKRSPAANETAVPQTDAPDVDAAAGAETSAPVLSAYAVPEKTESFTVAAIAGIIATVCFVALILMQYMEQNYYIGAFPSAGVATAAAPATPAAPAPAPAPAAPAEAPAPAPAPAAPAEAPAPAPAPAAPAANP